MQGYGTDRIFTFISTFDFNVNGSVLASRAFSRSSVQTEERKENKASVRRRFVGQLLAFGVERFERERAKLNRTP